MRTKHILISFVGKGFTEDVFVPVLVANNIPDNWEFCSRLNIPKAYKDKYGRAMNTKQVEYFNL